MSIRSTIGVVLTLLLFVATASASDSFGQLLARAEKIRSSDPKTFDGLLTQLDKQRDQASPKQLELLAYLKAYQRGFGGEYELAAKEALRLANSSTDVDIQFRAGALAVNSYALTRQFSEGLRQLGKTLSLLDHVKDPQVRQYGFWAAAVIYNQIGQYELGLQYAEKLLAEPIQPRERCFAGHSQLEAMHHLGSLPDDALIVRTIDLCVGEKELAAANFIRLTLARRWASLGRQEDAIALLKRHLDEIEGTRYPRLIAETRALLAEMQLQQGDSDASEANAHAAIRQGPSIAGTLPLATAHKVLYEIALGRGDKDAALLHYQRHAEADKAWLNEVKARELAYQIVRQEMLQKNQQIALLNQQNEVLQLQQQVQQQNAQNTRLLVLLLLLLLASIAFWAYKTKRVQMSLRRMAETDALTGICNRHHFTQQSELALAQCARAGEDVALVMFDLDHFKSINDRYGHDTGDWVLKQVVAVCAPLCRQIDYFGRIGGEEFAILLIGIDARGAKRLAEDCRVRIAGIDSGDSGYRFTASASFGLTTTALSGYDLAKMLSHADKMLYRAKRGGRDRVLVYEVPVPVQLPVPVGSAHDGLAPVPDAVGQIADTSDGAAAEERSPQRAVAVS